MTGNLLRSIPRVGLLVAVLAASLFGGALQIRSETFHSSWDDFLGASLHLMSSAIAGPAGQWMVMTCLAAYFLIFFLLRNWKSGPFFWKVSNPDLWLAGFVAIGTLVYLADYGIASQSAAPLILLVGLTLEQGCRLWLRWQGNAGRFLIPITVVFLLSVGSIWHPEGFKTYEYRGHTRWSGPWESPNYYGLLMGTGLLVALGLLAFQWHLLKNKRRAEQFRWGNYIVLAWVSLSAVLMGYGLLRSYSRGAWLAMLCGLGYLLIQKFRHPTSSAASRLRTWFIPGTIIILSAGILVFWHFRQTDWRPARRAFSVANANDFSWRNRVTVWEGSLQMIYDRPWLGFGWNQTETMYDHYYRPAKLQETAAIYLNDYLMLGSTLGLPALSCFLVYLGLCVTRPSKAAAPISGEAAVETSSVDWLRAGCLAGIIVLLVGFWFDGAFFKLPTAAVFWLLLALVAERRSEA